MTLRRFSINFTFHLKNHQSMDGPVSPVPSHHNVPVPFAADIPGGVFPGKAILLKGLVLNSSREHRIQVDLCCGKLVQGDHQDDKALHLNPRFGHGSLFSKPDRDFVLNSLVNNSWGPEQRCQNPLEQGKPFSLRILILRDYFKISVNGKHLSDFIHRVPLESIKCIFVAGCLSIDLIEYQGTRPGPQPSYPEPNAPCPDGLEEPIEIEKPEVPFIFKVPPGGFLPTREAHLVLTPLLNSISFAVNLLCADEYLFHMRVDFPNQNGADERGAVVRNSSTEGGQWQREERQMGRFPFVQGLASDVKLVAGAQGIRVFIDGAYFCDFNHRPSGPIATEVTQLTVLGDVGVQRFTFRNKATK